MLTASYQFLITSTNVSTRFKEGISAKNLYKKSGGLLFVQIIIRALNSFSCWFPTTSEQKGSSASDLYYLRFHMPCLASGEPVPEKVDTTATQHYGDQWRRLSPVRDYPAKGYFAENLFENTSIFLFTTMRYRRIHAISARLRSPVQICMLFAFFGRSLVSSTTRIGSGRQCLQFKNPSVLPSTTGKRSEAWCGNPNGPGQLSRYFPSLRTLDMW